jgi:rubrerythrin
MSTHHNMQACEACGDLFPHADLQDGLCKHCSNEASDPRELFEYDPLASVYTCSNCGKDVIVWYGDQPPTTCPECKRSSP